MDTLSKVLSVLDFESTFYFSARLKRKWGIVVPSYKRVARFHICCEGVCQVLVSDKNELLTLVEGDILVIPHGASHTLLSKGFISDDSDEAAIALDEAYKLAHYSGGKIFDYQGESGGASSELLCGHYELGDILQHPITEQLPSYILLPRAQHGELAWVKDVLEFYTREAQHEQPGNELIIKHLSEVIFTLAVQQWRLQQDQPVGFIAAIADPYLSKTLQAFHDRPERRWTLDLLAKKAGMSRTSFVDRFTNTVGMSPMQYIARWRMSLAQKLLRSHSRSIQTIANLVGYESVTAFTKAFKRLTGKTPREFRLGD